MDDRILGILQESFGRITMASVAVTIPLTVFGFALAMAVALFLAMVQYAKVPLLRQFARFYIWIFRGTPLLVQLFLAYFGLPKVGIVLDAFPCALVVLGLNEGAYCAETMRSALESVSEGQIEAGYCSGLSYLQIMWHIVLPQAFRTAFPPLSNSLIAMLKDTSLAATITVGDMFMSAQRVVGRTYEPLWVYCELALVYLFLSTLLTVIQRFGEKKLGSYASKEANTKETLA